jgi:hypothetical protein
MVDKEIQTKEGLEKFFHSTKESQTKKISINNNLRYNFHERKEIVTFVAMTREASNFIFYCN